LGDRRDTSEEQVIHLPPDHELEAPFAGDELTPVRAICPDCTLTANVLDDDVQPPALPSEAFRDLRCRGTRDPKRWRVCMTDRPTDPYGPGLMTLPSQEGMRVLFDRRRAAR